MTQKQKLWKNPVVLFSTLGVGFIPFAPGTFGTLLAIPVGILLMPYPIYLASLIVILFIAGIFASRYTQKAMDCKDPGSIVIDEFVAMLLVLYSLYEVNYVYIALAFILFRVFDIFKPRPIKYIEKNIGVNNGLGIMLDDIIAALYAIIFIYVIQFFFLLGKV